MAEPSQPSSGEDTGLGESQPDASLLFKDQKRFYENLMVYGLGLLNVIRYFCFVREYLAFCNIAADASPKQLFSLYRGMYKNC